MATFRGVSTGQTSGSVFSGAPLPYPGAPTGAVTGDTVFWCAVVFNTGGVTVGAWPSGWTEVANLAFGAGSRLIVAQHTFTTGESAPTGPTLTGGNPGAGVDYENHGIAYSGLSTVSIVATNTGASGNGSVSGLSASRGNGLLLALFGNEGVTTSSAPSGMTERFENSGSQDLSLDEIAATSTSATGTKTNTFSATTAAWGALSLALDVSGAYVGASLSGVTFPLRHAGLGPFISSGGNVYFFGRDSVNTGTVEPHKASDPMSAFTAQTAKTMSSATTTAIEAMWAGQRPSSNVVDVFTQISTGAVYYNSYTMDTDAWGLATSAVTIAAASFAPATGATFVSAAYRPTAGELVLEYNAGQTAMSSTFNMVRYARVSASTGAIIGSAANIDNGGSINWLAEGAALGASDRVHFFMKDATNGALYQRTLTAANALQTFPASFTAASAAVGFISPAPGSYLSGANTVVRVHQAASVGLLMAELTSADAPTVSVMGAYPDAQGAANINNMTRNTMAHDGSTAHALMNRSASAGSLYHDTYSGAWGTDVLEASLTTINLMSANVYTRSGTKYLAMVLDDNGTVKYAEIALPAAAVAYAPKRVIVSKAAVVRSSRY